MPDTVSADNGRGGPVVRKLDPEVARKRMISYGMEPTEPYPGAVDSPWPGICLECKQPGSPTLSNAKRQGVCKPCGQARAAEALRLPLSDVVRALEGRGVIVIGDYKNNREGIECICLRCGALIYPAYSNAMREGVGLCDRQCKRERIGDSNRADAEEAAEFARANDLIPLAPYTGADDPWPLECARCGHVGSKTTYSVIKQLGHVCAACGRVRTANARRLQAVSAVQSMLDAKLKPDVPYPGRVNDPWPCTCMVCKTKIRPGPRLNDVRNGGQGGCVTCSDTSFKQGEPAHIYLVVNYETRFLKWGKANDVANRLREHARQGFDHDVGRWPFALGAEATLVERAIKAEVRALGATTQVDKGLMRYKGHTETASLDEVTVTEVLTIIQCLITAKSDLSIPADPPVSVPRPTLIGTPRAQLSRDSLDGPSVISSARLP
ncbi:hypothetical protein GTY20_02135 [Streptomyces sp. SID4946]|uniref:hypothetical protein n=1 Tax=Streptomyces sp. LamerLS-31b TaxID=1839765 RepID=UPI00114D386B|nr:MULTISPECIES: hypothetical protein [unclassified Streptomyces]MYQ90224.1 hypothetical protein [Streptomyces sp. SID4946]